MDHRTLRQGPQLRLAAACPSRENASVSDEGQPKGPLSEPEFQRFTEMLRRFCEHDLDQWESWRCRTTYGYVYIDISRELPEGHPEGAYADVPPLGISRLIPCLQNTRRLSDTVG